MRPIRLPPEVRLTHPDEEEVLRQKIKTARKAVKAPIPPLLNLKRRTSTAAPL